MERLPLNAMQAFIAAARTASFAAAGVDQGVSAAAISQQVRLLEDRFGKQLFFRRAKGVELTDAGRDLFLRLSGAFADLSQAVAHLKAATSRHAAVISVMPSVGELWLLPRLAELVDRAGVQVIEEAQDPIDFAAQGVDIRITYGAVAYPHLTHEVLFHDRMIPVAAPHLAATLREGAVAAPDPLLIHTNWGPTFSSPHAWNHWLEAAGSARSPDTGKGLGVERLAVAAVAARQGLGVALLPETLAAADLAMGSLIAVGPALALLPQPYVMIARPTARHRSGVEPIWRHLLSQARTPAPQ